MSPSPLESISPLDGRYHNKVGELSKYFSEFALIRYRVYVEVQWFRTLCEENKIPEAKSLSKINQQKLDRLLQTFSTSDAKRIKQIERTTNHDVKAVEYWLTEQFALLPGLKNLTQFLHFGCTSEDINNICHGLMLKGAIENIIMPAIEDLIKEIETKSKNYASIPMISRTHGQPASPTTLGKEIANFVYRLRKQAKFISKLRITAKMNGAVGNFNAHIVAYPKVNWQTLSKKFINKLGLTSIPYTTQIEPHDTMAELFDALKRFNTVLLDLDKDFWSYISMGYLSQKANKKEVGSSTMPHKVNPIDFENSEGNLGIANCLLTHFSQKLSVSRLQRDLSDSTVIRNNGVIMGHCWLGYMATLQGLQKLMPNYKNIEQDLHQRWEVLAEPIQTVMRRHGISNAYEALKELTRGQSEITEDKIKDFIKNLEIPEQEKERLLALSPDKYIGLAEKLAINV